MMTSRLSILRNQPGLQLRCSKCSRKIITSQNVCVPLAFNRQHENAELLEKKSHGVPVLGTLASVGLSGPAHADEIVAAAADSAQTAAQQLTSAPAPDDPLITVMFSIAIAALSVVTLGVAYLSFASWNDSRQENEDKLRQGRKLGGSAPSVNSANGAKSSEESPVRRKKDPKAARTDKGFGRK